MKKVYLVFVFLILFGILIPLVSFAQKNEVKTQAQINFFYSPTCPHCAKEQKFLDNLAKKYPKLKIERFSIFKKENVELLKKFYVKYKVPQEEWGITPITFTETKYFLGFDNQIGQKIEACIEACLQNEVTEKPKNENEIILPFIGALNPTQFSPLALSVIMGGLDGFNACAMVALGFLLTVLISTGARKKVFLIGGTFIFVSGLVYFLFISAWFNLFIILEQVRFITYIVGIVIAVFAVFLLKDYFRGIICKLCELPAPGKKESIWTKIERKLFQKMQNATSNKLSLPLTLLAVALVAAGINSVELVCSFGFPLAFTKFLSSLELPAIKYYFYLFIYILFYMLDDLLIFLIAVWTLRITKVSDKYLKFIKLISGILLLLLGLLMLIKPEALMFGT